VLKAQDQCVVPARLDDRRRAQEAGTAVARHALRSRARELGEAGAPCGGRVVSNMAKISMPERFSAKW
jgi:hypothetical protein